MVELPGPVAFFDGACNVCDKSVRSLMEHDTAHRLHYAPLQGETAAALQAERADFPHDLGTMVVAEPGAGPDGALRLWLRSDGVIRSIELTQGTTFGVRVARLIPRPVRDLLYRAFAANRYRLYGKKDVCALPTPEERSLLLP